MKITFLRDTPPMKYTGNEFYAENTRADLRHGAWLVTEGYAYEGWGKAPKAAPPAPAPVVEPEPVAEMPADPEPLFDPADEPLDLWSLRVAELRELAADAGVDGYETMRKADLIAALESAE